MKRAHLRRYFRRIGIRRRDIDEMLRYAQKGGLTIREAYEIAVVMRHIKTVARLLKQEMEAAGNE